MTQPRLTLSCLSLSLLVEFDLLNHLEISSIMSHSSTTTSVLSHNICFAPYSSLHSPLMAVTNAISGTTALGGMHLWAHSTKPIVSLLGATATTLSTINIVGTCRCMGIHLTFGGTSLCLYFQFSFSSQAHFILLLCHSCRRLYCNHEDA